MMNFKKNDKVFFSYNYQEFTGFGHIQSVKPLNVHLAGENQFSYDVLLTHHSNGDPLPVQKLIKVDTHLLGKYTLQPAENKIELLIKDHESSIQKLKKLI